MKTADLHADAYAAGEPVTSLDAFELYTAKACEELGRFIAQHHFGSDLAREYVEQKTHLLSSVAASFVTLRQSRIMREAGFHLPTARRMMIHELGHLDQLADRRLSGESTEEEHLEILAKLRHRRMELDAVMRCQVWLNGG